MDLIIHVFKKEETRDTVQINSKKNDMNFILRNKLECQALKFTNYIIYKILLNLSFKVLPTCHLPTNSKSELKSIGEA